MNKYTHRRIWLLERSLARSLDKLTHWAAVSLPRRLRPRFDLVPDPGLGSCEQQHSELKGPRAGPLATEGARRIAEWTAPLRRVPPRPPAAAKCHHSPKGYRTWLHTQSGYHVNNDEFSYCRTKMCFNETKMQWRKTQDTEHGD